MVAEIGKGILKIIQHLHSTGLLHRDIKPANILIDEENRPYLVDFGLAKKFVNRSKFHIPKIRKSGVTGTLRWTSLHVHLNCESARRDDVLSWIYMMLYMCSGKLPWQGIDAPNKKTKNIKIAKQK